MFALADVSSGPHVARHSLSYIQEIGSGWFGKVSLCFRLCFTSKVWKHTERLMPLAVLCTWQSLSFFMWKQSPDLSKVFVRDKYTISPEDSSENHSYCSCWYLLPSLCRLPRSSGVGLWRVQGSVMWHSSCPCAAGVWMCLLRLGLKGKLVSWFFFLPGWAMGTSSSEPPAASCTGLVFQDFWNHFSALVKCRLLFLPGLFVCLTGSAQWDLCCTWIRPSDCQRAKGQRQL